MISCSCRVQAALVRLSLVSWIVWDAHAPDAVREYAHTLCEYGRRRLLASSDAHATCSKIADARTSLDTCIIRRRNADALAAEVAVGDAYVQGNICVFIELRIEVKCKLGQNIRRYNPSQPPTQAIPISASTCRSVDIQSVFIIIASDMHLLTVYTSYGPLQIPFRVWLLVVYLEKDGLTPCF